MLLLYQGNSFNANFFRSTGVEIDNSFYLEDKDTRTLLVSKMNESYAEEHFEGEVIPYRKNPVKQLEKLIRKKKVEADLRSLPASLYVSLSSFCKLEDASQKLLKERMRKTPYEAKLIKKAASECKDLIHHAGLGSFGKKESDIASELLSKTYSKKLTPAFPPIIAGGENSAYPHSSPEPERVHGICLVDYGVKYGHYCSDLTRVFFEDRNKEAREIYEFLKGVVGQLVEGLPDFKNAKELATAAEKLFVDAKIPLPPHSFGHGIGLEVHELPTISKNSKDTLENTVFALEPSVYLPGKYGLRYEEVIHFDGKKGHIL